MATIKLPYPHTGQRIVRGGAKRFNWLAAGRRWRKTTMVMAIAVEAALEGQTIIWGAPVFDQVRVGWDETRHAAGGIVAFNQSRMIAQFPSGGKIVYRSLDNPDNVRGHTADGVVVDECADVQAAAWYEVLRPMLIDTNGWAWLIGTPKGRNWYWHEHIRSIDLLDSAAWQAPTIGVRIAEGRSLERDPHPLENPYIPFSEIVNLFETMPADTFRQEVMGLFIESAGSVFRNIPACLHAPTDSAPYKHEGHELTMGVDWAQKVDFTCLSVVCSTCRCEVAFDRFNQIGWDVQRGRLKALYDRWKPYTILAESNSIGGPNIEALINEDLPVMGFETTASSKPQLIKSLVLAFERAEFQWLPDPVGKAELEAYEATVSPATGRVSYSAPEGQHDDSVISRALAFRAASMWQTV